MLRIICNIKRQSDSHFGRRYQFLSLYVTSSSLTAVGNFVLFWAILSILNNWANMMREILNKPLLPFQPRLNTAVILLTVVALAMTITASSTNNNMFRIIGNASLLVMVLYLLILVRYYRRVLADTPESTIQGSKQADWTSHRHAVEAILAFCLVVLIAAQAFKLAQSVAPVSSPALKKIPLIYIFGPVPDLIILIVLAVTWGPVFHNNIYTKMNEWRGTQLPMGQTPA